MSEMLFKVLDTVMDVKKYNGAATIQNSHNLIFKTTTQEKYLIHDLASPRCVR